MKLMEQIRQVLRVKHYALATEQCYCQWIRRFIFFHGVKHPETMGAEEVERFLTHLATVDKVAASTQNQALNALVFLYREVLRMDLGNFDAVRARRPVRVPTVLSQVESAAIFGRRATAQNDGALLPHVPADVRRWLAADGVLSAARKDVDLGAGS